MVEVKLKFDLEFVNTCLVVILVAILITNVYLMNSLKGTVAAPKQTTPVVTSTPAKLASVELIAVIPDCNECFNISALLPQLKSLPGANVTKQTVVNQKDAKELIEKYGLTRLPALIIAGEVSSLKLPPDFVKKDDALVLEKLPPPYFDLATGSVKGTVSVKVLNAVSCTECKDLSAIVQQLKTAGVQIDKQEVVNSQQPAGIELIKKYNIKVLPTVILSSDILEYPGLKESVEAVSEKAKDGSLVLVKVPPPYYELDSKKVRGNVDAVLLSDKSCTKCVNTSTVKQLFIQLFGLSIKSDKELDVSSDEAKKILSNYNITKVPTILLSDEFTVYPASQQWSELGTKEDKWFVFKNVELLGNFVEGNYKDLTANKEVEFVQSN